MLKRLRDRSTLRPPPDEPPIKRRVPPEPFPLEGIPHEFYSYIVEKMSFSDFKTFNQGSKLSAKICEDLRFIEADVEGIYIGQDQETFQTSIWRRNVPLTAVPLKIRLYTQTLTMHVKNVNSILKYNISAEFVRFWGDTGSDPEFVKEVIQLTNPDKVYVRSPSADTLALEELKEIKDVIFRPWINFSDTDLLGLNLEFFTIDRFELRRFSGITSDGILRLLKEWKDGTRNITKIKFPFRNLDEEAILREFDGYREKLTNRLILCRDGTIECAVDLRDWRYVKLTKRMCLGKH